MFYFTETLDSVPVGGNDNVKVPREDYEHINAASKPSAMALQLVDKLFLKETLLRSTVTGTKELPALDREKITAIRGKINSMKTPVYSVLGPPF